MGMLNEEEQIRTVPPPVAPRDGAEGPRLSIVHQPQIYDVSL